MPWFTPLPWSRWPLLPVAGAATVGLVLDRWLAPPLLFWVLVLVIVLLARLLRRPMAGSPASEAVWLWLIAGVLAALWHHLATTPTPSDIAHLASDEGRLIRLRGYLQNDPAIHAPADPRLVSQPDERRTTFTLVVSAVDAIGQWRPSVGKLRVTIGEAWPAGRLGQHVELLGSLFPAPVPMSPGSGDPRAFWADRGIFALLFVKNAAGVRPLDSEAAWSPLSLVAAARAAGQRLIRTYIAASQQGVALALVLGEQSALRGDEFEGYQRTGVFHVLAVSGQHLVLLCFGLGLLLRLLGLTRRQQVGGQLAFVIFYTLLTGAEPPVLRAAFMVGAVGLGTLLRRPVEPLNSLCLAWLLTIAVNPADVFQPGVQLSFLAVLVLFQGVGPLLDGWLNRILDPLTSLEREYEPGWLKVLRLAGRWLLALFLAGVVVWLATVPLVAVRFHLFSPVAILVGPPVMILSSLALMAGFVLLLVGSWWPVGGQALGWLVSELLGASNWLVALALKLPGGHAYVPDLPEWTLVVAYGLLFLFLFQPWLLRWWKPVLLVLMLAVFLVLLGARPTTPNGLRLTVLAVGHGNCAVAETAEGQVLLFDVGSLGGPEVAPWVIAPYLWSRGHSRIDEVFLSHADLDHFNGLPALLDRFRIGQISVNPTFEEKASPGAESVLARIRREGVPIRRLFQGMKLAVGSLGIEVLHPPQTGPPGTENARSLVLLLRHGPHQLLLTGDLEPPGLAQVLSGIRPRLDVLIAPHHGSPLSNTEEFAAWADAGLVISSEGWPRGRRPDPYSPVGSLLWRTRLTGSVTIEATANRLRAAAFHSRDEWQGQPLPPRR